MSQQTTVRITGSNDHLQEIDANLAKLAEGQAALSERLSKAEFELSLLRPPANQRSAPELSPEAAQVMETNRATMGVPS